MRCRRLARVRRRRWPELLLATVPLTAHHEILAKFDDKKPVTLSGVVTLVDWRNPHVHVFMNVKDAKNETRQLGGRTGEPDRSAAERLEPRHAAARGCDHGRGHRRPGTAAARSWGKSVVADGDRTTRS